MRYERDPASRVFDPLTRRALSRCYANHGRWVPVRLPRLTPRVYVAWYGQNVDLRQRDPWSPELNRWARSFIRSAYYMHRWHGGFDGLVPDRRSAPFDGLALVFDATEELAGWRVRLMTAEKGDRRLPRRRQGFSEDGTRNGIRVGGVGAGSEL